MSKVEATDCGFNMELGLPNDGTPNSDRALRLQADVDPFDDSRYLVYLDLVSRSTEKRLGHFVCTNLNLLADLFYPVAKVVTKVSVVPKFDSGPAAF